MSKSKRWMILTGSVSGLLALLAVLFAVNFMLVPVRARLDMTDGKLYTLSDGSRAIMAKLAYPVTLKLFFNGSSPDMPAPLKTFARQVEDLVREYASASNGKIIVEKYDPAPDSDAEEWAQRYGLSRQELGLGGPSIVLGLVAECGSVQACIPFFDPRADDLLEYNISRLIYRVANPKKPVVGVLSSLPVTGMKSIPMMMQRMPSKPAWVAFQQLAEDNDIREVAADTDKIDPSLDLLIVVHPKNLTDKTLYALDQFVLRGGRLLAFVDPMSLVDRMAGNPEQMPGMPNYNSQLNRLIGTWGFSFEPMKLVADLEASTGIRTSETEADESPVFLSLKGQNVNPQDI
ncbi:MAG: GldG family protein, partial [Lentisphaerae bacterium]|nr:GldG family protein [Lentisphaerota bacterium]